MNKATNQTFTNNLQTYIKTYKIKSILIAISGGQDSICLIKLLNLFISKHKQIKLEYIYIDHQWKLESKNQIIHIINYLRDYQSYINIYQIKQISLSENLARKLRYHTIINHAINYNYQVIITAHTQTDKIETFFLNLIRGSTIEGATSLIINKRIHQQIYLFRPLISINRININSFCKQYFLPIWSDITNYNYNIQRNRIRYELIPYINKYFNPNFEINIINFLRNCYYDNEYIKKISIYEYMLNKHSKYMAINYLNINRNHLTIKTRVLQIFIYSSLYISTSAYLITKLVRKIQENKLKTQIKWNNIQFNISRGWLYITFIN